MLTLVNLWRKTTVNTISLLMVSPYLIYNLYVDKSNTVYKYLQAIGAKIYFSFNFLNVRMRHTEVAFFCHMWGLKCKLLNACSERKYNLTCILLNMYVKGFSFSSYCVHVANLHIFSQIITYLWCFICFNIT